MDARVERTRAAEEYMRSGARVRFNPEEICSFSVAPGSGALIPLFVAAEFESAGGEKSPKFRLPRTEIHIQFSGPDRQPQ